MDPFTIATTATGIVKSCYTITATVYTFVEDSRNVDSNVDDLLREIQGLSRAAEAIGSTWNKNPMIITAQAGVNGNLWGSVGTSLEDCQITLARLNSKLDELKKGGIFSRGFLRKPTKLVMLNMKQKDIVAFKQQIQSYNSAMQSALLMINVCLSLSSNSSQETVVQTLAGLKTQIGHLRMETSRQGALMTGFATPEMAQDNWRMTQNLQSLIQQAEALHSSASTVIADDRSTVWDGSILGDPLNDEQYSSIRNWIPPPAISEEDKTTEKPDSNTSFLDSAIGDDQTLDQDSDADSDIEKHLLKRYGEVAMASFKQRDYPKAESFFRKVREIIFDADTPDPEMNAEIRETSIMLAYSCALQAKWEAAETILHSTAMEKGSFDVMPLYGLYAFALVYLAKSDYETAIMYCKRVAGGFRKILGKFSVNYYDSMALLAHIFDRKGDAVSAEGCRTFLPAQYNASIELDPLLYLEKALTEFTEDSTHQIGASASSLNASETQATETPRSISVDQAKSPFLSPDAIVPLHSRSRSIESLTNTVGRINLGTEHHRSNLAEASQPSDAQQILNLSKQTFSQSHTTSHDSSNIHPPAGTSTKQIIWIPNIRFSFVTAQDQAKFETLFRSTVKDAGGGPTLPAIHARDLLARSKLDSHTLAQIWALADTGKSGELYFPEFVLAMYLCSLKILGNSLPSVLPGDLEREVMGAKEIIKSHETNASFVRDPKTIKPDAIDRSQQIMGSRSNSSSFLQLQEPANVVVAIDFGISDTAVAWGLTRGGGKVYGKDHKFVNIINEWPHSNSGGQLVPDSALRRVPTILYYDQNLQVVGWGFDLANAVARTGYPKPGVLKLQWFNCHLLVAENSYIDRGSIPPLPPGKSEIDVTVDFLRQVFQTIWMNLFSQALENGPLREIHYCFTLPAVWGETAKVNLHHAIIQAGFLKDENDSRFSFINEGEASAIAWMNGLLETGLLRLELHNVVLIVGCGTGTVDLNAYQLERTNPYSFVEFTKATGDSCGASAINQNFANILRARLRKMATEAGSNKYAGRAYAKSILEFENRIKTDFRNNGQKWAVDVGINQDFPEAGIEEGYMVFTNEEILQCFKPVVDRVLDLIRYQVLACQAQNGHFQNILITGPFGTNEYLFQQIKLHCPPEYQSKVIRPMDSETIAVRGAVIAASERFKIYPTVQTSLAMEGCSARTYVLDMPIETRTESHRVSDACKSYHCLDGVDRRYDSARIILRKGQPILNFQPLRFTVASFVTPGSPLFFSNNIYFNRSVTNDNQMVIFRGPNRHLIRNYGPEDVFLLGKITTDLSHIRLEDHPFRKFRTESGVFYMVEYDLVVEVYAPLPRGIPHLVIKSIFGLLEFGTVKFEIETE